jgi:integrase
MTEKRRIGHREIASLGPNSLIWDTEVSCFGARRQKSESISYIVFYRTSENRQRFHTIGRHGAPWTPEAARKEAKRVLGSVVNGADPAEARRLKRHAESVSELCDLYFADAKAGRVLTRRKKPKKASTLLTDESRAERHIKPLLGRRAVLSVSRADIESFMHSVAEGKTATRTKTGKKRGLAIVRGGKGAATRTVGLLGAIFTYAVRRGIRNDNPVRGVERFADGQRLRRLSEGEYSAAGRAIRRAAAEGIWPAAVAAARFLAVTGWRTGEVVGLRRSEVDLARRTALLGDTKTGQSIRPLSHAACDILRERVGDGDLLFPASKGEGSMTGFPRFWNNIAEFGELPGDITPHVLRHSFASLANDLGYSEPTIAALIGHKGRSITSRYVHCADAVLLAAADAVANRTLELMGMAPTAQVIEFRQVASI